MTHEDAIAKILDDQISGYRTLLELLQKERYLLIDFDVKGIEELYKEKDVLILKLRLLEEERIRRMKDFGSSELTLKTLAEQTGNSKFLDMRSKLKSLVQAIEELNGFNRILIDRSLSYIKNSSGFFGTFGIGDRSPQKGMLLSRET
jgi:flagellar biosynthesis/type III secretory pathway chaperone